jgi:hypothetical protein
MLYSILLAYNPAMNRYNSRDGIFSIDMTDKGPEKDISKIRNNNTGP